MLYSSLRYDILFLSFFRLGGYSVHVTSPPLWEGRVGLAPYMFPPPFRSNSSVITRWRKANVRILLTEIKTTHHHQNAALPPHLVLGTPTQPKI